MRRPMKKVRRSGPKSGYFFFFNPPKVRARQQAGMVRSEAPGAGLSPEVLLLVDSSALPRGRRRQQRAR